MRAERAGCYAFIDGSGFLLCEGSFRIRYFDLCDIGTELLDNRKRVSLSAYIPSSHTYTAMAALAPRPLRIQKSNATLTAATRPSTSSSQGHSENDTLSRPRTSDSSLHSHGGPAPTYLRVLHQFQPQDAAQLDTVCLPLEAGQIVMVHALHPSGWADGSLLSTGERGWFPSNYCEPYGLRILRPLVSAVELVKGVLRQGHGVEGWGSAVACVVSAVRGILITTNCMTRESPLVRSSDVVRRERKILLSDLSTLIATARDATAADAEVLYEYVEDIQQRVERISSRASKFIEVVAGPAELWKYEEEEDEDDNGDYEAEFAAASAVPARYSMTQPLSRPATAHSNFSRPTSSLSSRPMTANSINRPSSSGSKMTGRKRADSSVSVTSTIMSEDTSESVLQKLTIAHDSLLSHLAAYIGRLHLQSGSPAELLATTKTCVASARNLLHVLDAVCARAPNAQLEDAKNTMFKKTMMLVSAAREVVTAQAEDEEEGPGMVSEEQGKELVIVATDCVRSAGEVVARARFVIESIEEWSERDENTPPAIRSIARDRSDSTIMPAQDVRRGSVGSAVRALGIPTVEEARNGRFEQRLASISSNTVRKHQSKSSIASSTFSYGSDVASSLEYIRRRDAEAKAKFEASIRQKEDLLEEEEEEEEEEVAEDEGPVVISAPFFVSSANQSQPQQQPVQQQQGKKPNTFSTDSSAYTAASFRDSLPSHRASTSTSATTPEPESPAAEKRPAQIAFNADGQVTGGTLHALVERMTMAESTPDALFAATFYLTFRLWTSPLALAEALIQRFRIQPQILATADWEQRVAVPIRLRVYNVFKGWMEGHWRQDLDYEALDVIMPFAVEELAAKLPQAGKRLEELCRRVSTEYGAPPTPRISNTVGKINAVPGGLALVDAPVPPPMISKSELARLRTWTSSSGYGSGPSVLDFDPTELARQLTLKESKLFCAITPEELVGQEFSKKNGHCPNVKQTTALSTDLAGWVAESILAEGDAKKRAAIIKAWVKVADRSVGLSNYSTCMAILCALSSSTIARLKNTWQLVSSKTKGTLDQLKAITDHSRNYAVYRARLRAHVPPCLPFLGLYLTDLTFIHEGNPSTRLSPSGNLDLINFDKYVKTTKIINEVQRFQIPYKLAEVTELQSWIDKHIQSVRMGKSGDQMSLWRRSLTIEPKEEKRVSATSTRMERESSQLPRVQEEEETQPFKSPAEKDKMEGLFAWATKEYTKIKVPSQPGTLKFWQSFAPSPAAAVSSTVNMGKGKPRGLNSARKLRNHRREQRWADEAFRKRLLGTVFKSSPFGGSSHAKGIVLEKIGVEAKQPNSAIRKCVRVQLIKNGKKVTAFVPNDGCLNFVDENDEVLLAGFGRKGKAKGDIPGVRFKVVKVLTLGLRCRFDCFVEGEEGEAPLINGSLPGLERFYFWACFSGCLRLCNMMHWKDMGF
ncbi:hypothetical protein G7K_3223-t2 [Saitoella complicata NRRL Y-17804]|uniref:Ras-GEF domain-containing protein n=1 Tax=Saitoella complicata (strain BCRC 22490 / CBS 7301 / JCM 7358 / NBRC 10748 / NRRL Y-17804) TaxID=698492 RepID=A0A0E9NGQ2_SAICN|nr:hypothetical protein G7K_3223-t2 [Saitoella complicata NRRL Y-17804]